MRAKGPARIWVGGVLLPALLLAGLTACDVQAERFEGEEPQRAGEFEVSMNVDPNPPKTGEPAEFAFEVTKGGEPVGASEKPRLMVDMPEMPMNTPEVPLDSAGDGRWTGEVEFPMAGDWAATLVLPSGEETAFEFEVSP